MGEPIGKKSSVAGWLKVELMGLTFLINQGCQQAGKCPHTVFWPDLQAGFLEKTPGGVGFFVTCLARFFCLVHSKKCQDGLSPSWLLPVTILMLSELDFGARHFLTRA